MGGYIGEAFVLECTARGIATCWLGASYKKSKVREFVDIKEEETLACIIAFGFYDGKVKHTKKKSIEQLTGLMTQRFQRFRHGSRRLSTAHGFRLRLSISSRGSLI